MPHGLNSPLSGRVGSGFGGGRNRHKNKILLGVVIAVTVPFALSTFAASVTVGTGALQFGQGSQQAIACDPNVFASLGEEWHSQPTPTDPSAGFFRVSSVAISNLDLIACRAVKLRIRLISVSGVELPIGPTPTDHVIQITLPNSDAPVSVSDPTVLGLTYLAADGSTISGGMAATTSLNVSGISIYDGTNLSPTNSDVIFYLDQTAAQVNLDASTVGRTTVETVNNPNH